MRLKQRISSKIFVITFLLAEAIILSLGATFYLLSTSILIRSQMEYAEQMLQKSDEYLKMNVANVQSFFLSVANDARLQNGSYEEIEAWLKDNLYYFIPNTKNIHLIEDGNVIASTTDFQWLILENETLLKGMEQISQEKRLYWIPPYFSRVSHYTETAAMKIPMPNGKTKILAIDLDIPKLYKSLIPAKSAIGQGELLLLDHRRRPIYGEPPYTAYNVFERQYQLAGIDPDFFKSGWKTNRLTTAAGDDLYLLRSNANDLGWELVLIMNQTQMIRPLNEIVHSIWKLALIYLLFSLVAAYAISAYISRPIRRISASMEKFSHGDLDTAIFFQREDELGLLAHHFNRMTARIRELIEDLKRSEERKKRSDFYALQAQIRPHFLFNTLNTIKIFANQGKPDQVDRLISLLCGQLHYSFHASPVPVTLREEITSVKQYAELMSTRYNGNIRLEVDIHPLTLECTIPKFTCQPLIENAIFHGLVPHRSSGHIFMATLIEGDHWSLIVEDDGAGMEQERMRELRLALEGAEENVAGEAKGVGLVNVHRRLSMMFGHEYKLLQLTSEPGRGTRIRMQFPRNAPRVPVPDFEYEVTERDPTDDRR